eukprot:TRINITY_DN1716_c0_g1_i1.p1 TRINITY_DN1716_c0_g1~~TRINITY_DN1716_c0_g1_i1.p1  ORF type:complete len:177 (+),score=17.61 TRINITY_DN1716_c0_g1_i1:49-579(+)
MAISYTTASLCATFVCVLLLLTSLGIDIYSTIELQSPSAPVIEFGFQEVRSDDASLSSRYECDGPVDLLTTFDCELVRDSGAATFALIFLALILYIAVGALVHYRKLFAVWVSIAGSLFTFSGMISWLAFAHQNLKDTGDDLSRVSLCIHHPAFFYLTDFPFPLYLFKNTRETINS